MVNCRKLTALLAIGAVPTATASIPAVAIAAPWQLERSDEFVIPAADGHAYRVMVAWPEGPPPAQGWPVLWVLDGEDNFAITAMTARRLARAGARSGIGEGVIVAIDSGSLPRRILDYTPAAPGYAIPAGAPASGHATGGGDAFLAFLGTKVRPEIHRRWKVDAGRETLMGHSFGGLLALHAASRNAAWSRYVVVSPSLWFGNGLAARELRATAPSVGRRMLIAGGDREGGPSGASTGLVDIAAIAVSRGIDARATILPGQNHGSTMMAAMADGIALAFGKEAK